MRFRANLSCYRGILPLVLGALLLGGCSTDHEVKLVRTMPLDIHDSYQEMSFKVLPAEEQVRLELNSDDPMFSFEGGYSIYEALVLPELAQPYTLNIESEVVKGARYWDRRVFFPVLTFLDEDKKQIKIFDALPYVTQKPVLAQNFIAVSLHISEELAAARYVVIHTAEDKLNKAIGYDNGEALTQSSGFTTMMFAPITYPRYRYEFAPQGWVRVKASSVEKVTAKTPVEY